MVRWSGGRSQWIMPEWCRSKIQVHLWKMFGDCGQRISLWFFFFLHCLSCVSEFSVGLTHTCREWGSCEGFTMVTVSVPVRVTVYRVTRVRGFNAVVGSGSQWWARLLKWESLKMKVLAFSAVSLNFNSTNNNGPG